MTHYVSVTAEHFSLRNHNTHRAGRLLSPLVRCQPDTARVYQLTRLIAEKFHHFKNKTNSPNFNKAYAEPVIPNRLKTSETQSADSWPKKAQDGENYAKHNFGPLGCFFGTVIVDVDGRLPST